jgi:hypothetical protein
MGFGNLRVGQSLKSMNHFWVHAACRVSALSFCACAQAFDIFEAEVNVSDL